MKKVFLPFLLLLILSSCQNSVDPLDNVLISAKDMKEWVVKNIPNVEKYNRRQWLQLDEKIKRTVYSTFNSEQKQRFWLDKLKKVKEMDWSIEEQKHLDILYEYVFNHKSVFEEDYQKNDELVEKVTIFAYRWEKEANEKFGWGKPLVWSIIANGNDLKDKKGNVIKNSSTINLVEELAGKEVCNCSQREDWCWFSSCGWGCSVQVDGCGTFWSEVCTGYCYDF